MDSDKNGIIERDEFMDYIKKIDGYKEIQKVIKSKGATRAAYNKMWNQVDIDNNGFCSFNEFLPLCLDMEQMCSKDHLRRVFALFDGDGNGKVSTDEFKQIILGDKIGNNAQDKCEAERNDFVWNKVVDAMGITEKTKEIDYMKFYDIVSEAAQTSVFDKK